MENYADDYTVAARGAGNRLYIARGKVPHDFALVDAFSFAEHLHGVALSRSRDGELAAVTNTGALYTLQLGGARNGRLVAPGTDEKSWHGCAFGGHFASLLRFSARDLQEYDLRCAEPSARQLLPEVLFDELVGAVAQPSQEPLHLAVALSRSLAVLDRRYTRTPMMCWQHDMPGAPSSVRHVQHGRRTLLLSVHPCSSRVALHEYATVHTAAGAPLCVPAAPPLLLPNMALVPASRELLASADLLALPDGALAVLQLSHNRDVYACRLVELHEPVRVPAPQLHPALLHRTLSTPPLHPRASRTILLPLHILSLLGDAGAEPRGPPLTSQEMAAVQESLDMPRSLVEIRRDLSLRRTTSALPSFESLAQQLAEASMEQPRPGEAADEQQRSAQPLYRHRVRGEGVHAYAYSRGSLLSWLSVRSPELDSESASAAASFWSEAAAEFSSRSGAPSPSSAHDRSALLASLNQSLREETDEAERAIPRLARAQSSQASQSASQLSQDFGTPSVSASGQKRTRDRRRSQGF
jgi:hypothetical protein